MRDYNDKVIVLFLNYSRNGILVRKRRNFLTGDLIKMNEINLDNFQFFEISNKPASNRASCDADNLKPSYAPFLDMEFFDYSTGDSGPVEDSDFSMSWA